jgi:hypothetical protein
MYRCFEKSFVALAIDHTGQVQISKPNLRCYFCVIDSRDICCCCVCARPVRDEAVDCRRHSQRQVSLNIDSSNVVTVLGCVTVELLFSIVWHDRRGVRRIDDVAVLFRCAVWRRWRAIGEMIIVAVCCISLTNVSFYVARCFLMTNRYSHW